MQLPNLPTDNLYKFQAFAGLTILILSIGFIVNRSYTLAVQLPELEHQTNVLKFQSDLLDKYIDKSHPQELPKQPALHYDIDSKKQELELKVEELSCKVKIAGVNNKLNIIVSVLFLFVSVYAINLTRIGFRNWKNRIQKYQDIIIKNEAKKYMKEK